MKAPQLAVKGIANSTNRLGTEAGMQLFVPWFPDPPSFLPVPTSACHRASLSAPSGLRGGYELK
jgi:hypothetical protein